MEEHIYKYYEYRRSKQHAAMVTSKDYKELIDIALDNRDFKWAKELYGKLAMKQKYDKMKQSWGG